MPIGAVTFRVMRAVRCIAIMGYICATISSHAQETATPKRPLRFGVNLLPAIAYRELAEAEKNAYTGSTISFRNEIEEPRFAYGANIVCALDLSKRFSIEGGIGYSLMGYQLNWDALTYGDMIDPNRGFIYQTNDVPINAIRSSYETIEVPLRLVLRCGQGRLSSITGAGLNIGYLLHGGPTNVLVRTDGTKNRSLYSGTDDYRTINLFPTLSTGAAYTLSDHIELRLEASGRYGVSRIVDAPITAHLWSAGVGCGVMWTP